MMKWDNYENGTHLTCNGGCESNEVPMMEHYVLEKLGIAQVGDEVVFRAGDRVISRSPAGSSKGRNGQAGTSSVMRRG